MKIYWKKATVIMTSMLMAISCSKNDNETINMESESYTTTFKITDAPIDNTNVQGVFITVSSVKIDGTSLKGFSKTTFDLAALVNGKTKTLGNLELEAGSYSNIELELDYASDANGKAPGCYIVMADGQKDQLEATATKIMINDTFEVFASNTNEIIIDFDLRKAIKEDESKPSNQFEFVSMSELSAAIRALNKDTSGMISGTANDAEDTSDKIVVYAYQKGSFDADVETKGQGASNITFANAVTSSEVSGFDNSYSLNFLEEGTYELVFVSYAENSNDFTFNSLLEVESNIGLNLGAINITSALQINANVMITGKKQ